MGKWDISIDYGLGRSIVQKLLHTPIRLSDIVVDPGFGSSSVPMSFGYFLYASRLLSCFRPKIHICIARGISGRIKFLR
jgi:hypothetical protein